MYVQSSLVFGLLQKGLLCRVTALSDLIPLITVDTFIYRVRCAQIPGVCSPGPLNFVQWLPVFMNSQVGTCFIFTLLVFRICRCFPDFWKPGDRDVYRIEFWYLGDSRFKFRTDVFPLSWLFNVYAKHKPSYYFKLS